MGNEIFKKEHQHEHALPDSRYKHNTFLMNQFMDNNNNE